MRGKRETLMVAAALAASSAFAGCQHDPALRAVDDRDEYVRLLEARGVSIESETRHVMLDFTNVPVAEAIDSDTLFVYLSIPIHPVNGIQFDKLSIGAGWSNVAMLFSGVLEPFSLHHERRAVDVRAWPLPEDASATLLPYANIGSAAEYAAHSAVIGEQIYRPGWQRLEGTAQFQKHQGTSDR